MFDFWPIFDMLFVHVKCKWLTKNYRFHYCCNLFWVYHCIDRTIYALLGTACKTAIVNHIKIPWYFAAVYVISYNVFGALYTTAYHIIIMIRYGILH